MTPLISRKVWRQVEHFLHPELLQTFWRIIGPFILQDLFAKIIRQLVILRSFFNVYNRLLADVLRTKGLRGTVYRTEAGSFGIAWRATIVEGIVLGEQVRVTR